MKNQLIVCILIFQSERLVKAASPGNPGRTGRPDNGENANSRELELVSSLFHDNKP